MAHAEATKDLLVLSRHWHDHDSELSFVIRSLAGAASRSTRVQVLTPGRPGTSRPDGAFDVVGVGEGADGEWPLYADVVWPALVSRQARVLVDELSDPLVRLLDGLGPVQPPLVAGGPLVADVGLHVPINPLAATHRHNGFGFEGYVLVLSDRSGPHDDPPAPVAWLTAGLHDAHIVVIEDAKAAVWLGRALRGVVSVDSRTDLWRLMAHARVCVDLSPGRYVARECVESLLFGTPIVVPAGAPTAARHAAAGGGMTFSDVTDVLACAMRFNDDAVRARHAELGQRYAEANYSKPAAFVANVQRALETA
jgi:hypothetical protein